MALFSWLLIISFLLYGFWKSFRPKNFPPGPWALPFLGNVLQLNKLNPLKDLEKFAKKYGPVFSLYIGGIPIVFVHGLPLIKEVLVVKGTEFAGRPNNTFINTIHKKKGIIMAHYGQAWKEQKKFSLMVLRNFGLGKRSLEERILEEATYLSQAFTENLSMPFDPFCLIDNAVGNIISTLVFGKRFQYNNSSLTNVVDLIHQNTAMIIGPWAWLYNILPLVRGLPLPHRTIFSNSEKIFAFFRRELEEHKANLNPGKPRDFIDAYLEEIEKPENKGSSFEEENMFIVMFDLFAAGSETTARTIQWGLLYLVTFPDIQENCQSEMDMVLGNGACLKYEDQEKLPYTNAVIHEIQRFSSVPALGIGHAPIKDTQLSGYTISKGTTVIINFASILCDKSQWKYPSEFNPSNFLNEQGEFMKPEAFLPFSAGPRVCLGENMARMELFLFLATILRSFQLSWPDESKAPDLTPQYGITLSPSHFKVSLKHRQQNEQL
ncbi:cytochrome P450 2J2-like isoform X1 [Rhineura floridana]|uniref:cytochrome P450 2J2-like isoform X1 n=1 Tax=Rhineura floridana TaxID=261503 RepID=UPI002AC88F34|nr:cytochrome P450 2J2-like isoform X1 [Rhineura floridana]